MRRLVLGLAGTLVAGVLSLTPHAAHAETTLCTGKSFDETMKCDPGWAVNMNFMHWRMYRGHNCTNYVAWRLIRDGVREPSYRLGNARHWADRAERHGVPVNSTPQVGAVGTWPGRNHIVYIEQVGPGWMLITEDSWSAKRYRRYIAYKGERGYPTKFIHFAGKNSIRGATPTVTGTPLVGQLLRANPGAWSPNGVKLAYRWLRDGVVIPKATGSTYRLTRSDAGKIVTVSVTGTYPGKLARTASSLSTTPVSAGTIKPATPTIAGDPIVGKYMTALPGAWTPSYVTLRYQWYADGQKISGADERTWKVGKKRIGKKITVRVTGSGPGFEPVTAESAPSPKVVKEGQTVGRVVPGTPTINPTPTMVVGDVITVHPGTWGPRPLQMSARWLRDGEEIPRPKYTWSYILTAADVGKRIQVEFTGTKPNFVAASARTPASPVVHARQPRPVEAPVISGSGMVGQNLTVDPGVWLPSGAETTVQWKRDGRPIRGATALTYRVAEQDLRHTITATLTTQMKGWSTDRRDVPAGVSVRATPSVWFKSIRPRREHSKRLMIGATLFGQPTWGRVNVLAEDGEVLRTLGFSKGKPAFYDYVDDPGRYRLTLQYVGPEWLVQSKRDVIVIVK